MDLDSWAKLGKEKKIEIMTRAGLPVALASAGWRSLSKTEHTKIEKVMKGSGWYEQKDPETIGTDGQSKAKRHHEVAVKKGHGDTLREPLETPESKFMQNPAPFIDEFAELYKKVQHIEKWVARKDYIALIIKKALEHTVSLKEARHFIDYTKEAKEDVAQAESKIDSGKTADKFVAEINSYTTFEQVKQFSIEMSERVKAAGLQRGSPEIGRIVDAMDAKRKQLSESKKISPIDAELLKVQTIIDNFKTREDFNQGMHVLGQISLDYHPSISQQEKMREMAQILNKKVNELEKRNNSIYDDLVKKIESAQSSHQLDDLNQDANRAELKGEITNAQLQEIYMRIRARDREVAEQTTTTRNTLQAKYHVGDILERLPDIDSTFKKGYYKITEIVPHLEYRISNDPAESQLQYAVNEYKIAAIGPDGVSLIPVQGAVFTVTSLENTFRQATRAEVGEKSKSDLELNKAVLLAEIKKFNSNQLNEFERKFHDMRVGLINSGKIEDLSNKLQDIQDALIARRKELASSDPAVNDYTKKRAEYESKNLEYEAQHIPKELQENEIKEEDIKKFVWGLQEDKAIEKYSEKELEKYQRNVDYVKKEKETLAELYKKFEPYTGLTRAQIQQRYPKEEAEKILRMKWEYDQAKKNHDKNMQGFPYWEKQVERIKSGEWAKVNLNTLRERYAKEVKEAIKHGKPVPQSIVSQYPEFKKAQGARERYEKGRHTSFANRSIAIDESMKAIHGVKVKRQDGKAITIAQKEEIASDLKEIQAVIGDITDIMRNEDLTIAHTSGTNPFLSQAGGVYHPLDRTVTVGTGTHASAHELTHALDWAAKDRSPNQPLYDFKLLGLAKATMNTGAERLMSLSRKEGDELAEARAFRARLGKYWTRPEEILARLIEQYISYKNPNQSTAYDSFENYTLTPAWWSEQAFMELLPMIEAEIQRKIRLARGA